MNIDTDEIQADVLKSAARFIADLILIVTNAFQFPTSLETTIL